MMLETRQRISCGFRRRRRFEISRGSAKISCRTRSTSPHSETSIPWSLSMAKQPLYRRRLFIRNTRLAKSRDPQETMGRYLSVGAGVIRARWYTRRNSCGRRYIGVTKILTIYLSWLTGRRRNRIRRGNETMIILMMKSTYAHQDCDHVS